MALLCAYVAWMIFFKLLILTLTTYLVVSSSAQQSKLQDIHEALSAGELGFMGLGALIFTALIPLLNPISSTTFREIFTPERFEKRYLLGFSQGAVFACCASLAFLLSGTYRYLGFFIHFEDMSFALGSVLLRALSLGVLVYCEEFLFRNKLLKYFKVGLDNTQWNQTQVGLATALLLSFGYCATKALQFDLGWMHLLTLFLVSLSLSIRSLKNNDFTDGAGFWSAVLIIFHSLLSLPILGNDFAGLILVKYQSVIRDDGISTTGGLLRFLSGGQGGPLSAFAIQLLFLLDVTRCFLRYKQVCQPQILPKPVL